MKPTVEELLSLKKVLVRGNKKIKGVLWSEDTRGRGGSNLSPLEEGVGRVYTLEELSDSEIKREHLSGMGMYPLTFAILAVVDDVIYLGKFGSDCKINEIPCGGSFGYSAEIAYDTELIFTVMPVVDKE